MTKQIKSPFIGRLNNVKGQKDFATHYITTKVKKVVKPIAENSDEFVVKTVLIEEKTNIKELINSQASEVGVYNILDRVAKTGDTTIIDELKAPTGEQILDVSNMPLDMASAQNYAKQLLNVYNALPESIRAGRSFAQFCESYTQAEYDSWVASQKPVETKEEK